MQDSPNLFDKSDRLLLRHRDPIGNRFNHERISVRGSGHAQLDGLAGGGYGYGHRVQFCKFSEIPLVADKPVYHIAFESPQRV